jgi:selenium metabolism protein YedF
VVSTDKLGEGNDDLGTILMKGYLYTLSENDIIPKELIFLNGGVKLTVKESEVLESLKTLEKRGVKILSCGTCLDFYGIKEELAIGEISNMYTIVESMNTSSKVIKL